MGTVAAAQCTGYEEYEIRQSIKEIFKLLDISEKFVSNGDRILLKVNLLMGKPPEAAVTTHPVLVSALAGLLLDAGAGEVIIGDSPGGPFSKSMLKRFYSRSGLTGVAEISSKIKLNYNTSWQKVSFSEGRVSKSFCIADFVTEADLIINIPKLKTHGLTRFTGAVKNLFGVIPGLKKGEYHFKSPEVAYFCEMLLDLAELVKPDLNIMDAVVGMEGEGPSGGTPREFGYLLGSPAAEELDLAAAYLLGIKPLTAAPQIKRGAMRGLPSVIEELNLKGVPLKSPEDVDVPPPGGETNLLLNKLPAPLARWGEKFLKPRPVVNSNLCVGCGVCAKSCPVETIELETVSEDDGKTNDKVSIELENCIRCFCCQELCQYEAIRIKRPLLGRIFFS